MTKKNLSREIKDAAAPAIEVVRLLVEQMRQQGQSDAEILAALDRLERDNPAKVDADVMAVVMGEIRKSIRLALLLLGALDVVLEQDLNREVEAGRVGDSLFSEGHQQFLGVSFPMDR